MAIPGLSEASIRAHASPDSFSRGRSYYDSDAVVDVTQRGNTIQGEVEGSQYTPYRIQIAFDQGGVTSATCTCPYDWGGWCKHIVAVLLADLYEGDEIEIRPTLETLLADLDRAQLQALLLGLAARDPNLADSIERQIALLQLANAAPQSREAGGPTRRSQIDQTAIRRQVRAVMQAAKPSDRYHDYYDDEEDAGAEVVAGLRPVLEQVRQFIIGGDGRSALAILDALTDEYLDGYRSLYDEYEERYGSYEGEASEFFGELADAWAEAILSAELSADERDAWAEKLANWSQIADDLGAGEAFDLAVTAADQGWDYPPLQRVLAGEIGEQGAWEEESPDYADELAQVRLRILERQGRQQEYLYLAEAEGQLDRYVIMLAKLGRTQAALDEGLKYLTTPSEILETAKVLRERGDLEAALQLAEHGLALPAPSDPAPGYGMNTGHQKAALADWTADLAAGMGQGERALRAAELAFRVAPSLNAYRKAQDLAGERWKTVKPELLTYLRQTQAYIGDAKIDVFLHEGLIDDAITAVQERGYYGAALTRVMDAALATRPDWVIKAAAAQAERIMNAGKANHYDDAVSWLRRARDAYRSAGRENDWRAYLQSIRTEHGRKHKLMGLMKGL
ncbi:MAG: SWIM zinc finger domain-containing protein [Roseiflexaceae bacterium]